MIRVGIYGYGNIGKGIECGIRQNSDMVLAAVFTRRNPSQVKTVFGEVPVYSADEVLNHKDDIDVMIMCGGSATDLPVQTPTLAEHFNVIDSFDTHARIAEHYSNVDKAAKLGGKTAIISVGWDPGLFSLNRLYAEAILPEGNNYTFWGKGISQGHSDAIRRIDGVVDARQYTVPVPEAVEAVRNGENPELTTRMKHTRECYVVAADGADKEKIEREIKTMPNYFADYDTTVTFVSQEELNEKHGGLPHQGIVFRSGCTGVEKEHNHIIEYSLKLDSNPEFTASAILAYARAACKLNKAGDIGCKTVLDIAPSMLSQKSGTELMKYL